jgi:hypothetical protein
MLADAFHKNIPVGTLNAGANVLATVDAGALAILLNRFAGCAEDIPQNANSVLAIFLTTTRRATLGIQGTGVAGNGPGRPRRELDEQHGQKQKSKRKEELKDRAAMPA